VNYTVGGTATLGTDYSGIAATPATKTVSFAAGAATATVTVDPTADTTIEPDETVALTLAAGPGYSVGLAASATGTITNDDVPSITLAVSPSPASVTEDGSTNLIYTFTRTGATTSALTVNYTISGTATNGSDYALIPATVTFAAGSATAVVTVVVARVATHWLISWTGAPALVAARVARIVQPRWAASAAGPLSTSSSWVGFWALAATSQLAKSACTSAKRSGSGKP
jgi:hypothetical protein